MSTLTHFGCS